MARCHHGTQNNAGILKKDQFIADARNEGRMGGKIVLTLAEQVVIFIRHRQRDVHERSDVFPQHHGNRVLAKGSDPFFQLLLALRQKLETDADRVFFCGMGNKAVRNEPDSQNNDGQKNKRSQ